MAAERADDLRYVPAPIRSYSPDHGDIPLRERLTLNTLADAVRSMARAYVYQKNTPFYPPNVSNERILEAGEKDPQILSEYTMVKLEEGNLIAVPYHDAFRLQLRDVSELLVQAKWYPRDPNLAYYLERRAQNLLDGNYEESESIWLESPATKIRAVIGPYDRYNDKRLNRKYSFSAHVGTLDEEETNRHQPIVDSIVEEYIKSGISKSPISQKPKVRIRYDKTEVSGGLIADMGFTADSYPCQVEWRQKHGTEIVLLEPPFFDKFRRYRLPLIREIIAPEHRRIQSDSDLRQGYAHRFDTHETLHALVRRPRDEQRFGAEYSFMNEMACTIEGLAMLSRIGLTNKQLEAVLMAELAIAADEYALWKRGKSERESYLFGEAIILNTLIRNESLYINDKGEIDWRDIKDIFDHDINLLARTVDVILTDGNLQVARDLKKKLADLSMFERLKPNKRPLKYHTDSYGDDEYEDQADRSNLSYSKDQQIA